MTQDTHTASGAAIDRALDSFERRERGIPQARIAAELVAELRAALASAAAPAQQPGAAYAAAAAILEEIAQEPPINGNHLAQARVLMAADSLRASHGQAPASKIEGLTAAQESLGVEFEKVLHDNLFDLYEESAPYGQAPAQPAPELTETAITAKNPAAPVSYFEDSRTQAVYEVLVNDNYPPAGSNEHWEGWKARLIVDALFPIEAPAAVAGPLNELEELNLLNKLVELGAKAAYAHAQSNSDDGHKGTAAYVQWQEMRAEMGELIRSAYAAPTAKPAPQQEARPVTPYTCPKCSALWLHWPAEQSGFGRDTLNCRSTTHCDYCEKGGVEQLQRLERVPAVLAAPQQEAQEPCPSCRNSDIYACTCPFPTSRNAAPKTSPASQGDALDAARLDWLQTDFGCRVFHLGKFWYTRDNFGMPYRKRASLREAIDAARAAHQEGEAP